MGEGRKEGGVSTKIRDERETVAARDWFVIFV